LARATKLVADSEGRLLLSDAIKSVSRQDRAAANHYLEQFDSASSRPAPTVESPVMLNLRRQPIEGFVELVGRVQREQRIDLHAAIRIVSAAHPDLAAAYSNG
jgi:hypothetical protein